MCVCGGGNPPRHNLLHERPCVDSKLQNRQRQEDAPRVHPTHVAAVRQLRHREAAGQAEGADVVKVLAPVLLCAQVEHAACLCVN